MIERSSWLVLARSKEFYDLVIILYEKATNPKMATNALIQSKNFTTPTVHPFLFEKVQ